MIQPEDVRTLEFKDLEIVAFRTRSLGNWSYLVSSAGEAVAIDPQRDASRYLEAAATTKLRLRHVIETHIHSDYLSGGLWLSDRTGAKVVASARGGYEFGHLPVDDGDELRVGGMRLRCLATPGHTPEHLAWELFEADSDAPVAVLTGGSLLAGGAGRTDLLGDQQTQTLTELQYESIRKVSALAETALILPTHGGGSTCSVAAAEPADFATVAQERGGNPYLVSKSFEQFRLELLRTVAPVPPYFRHVAALNREGPPAVAENGPVEQLDPARFSAIATSGAWVVDARNRWSFADTHIRGSLSIEPSDLFPTYVGSLVPFGAPIVLVVDDGEVDLVDELANECFRIGYRVVGLLKGGIRAWTQAGLELESYPATDILEILDEASRGHPSAFLDVRDPSEMTDGTLPGSTTVAVGALAERAPELRNRWSNGSIDRIAVACTGGARAAVAASFLARSGIPVRVVLGGGIPDALGIPSMVLG